MITNNWEVSVLVINSCNSLSQFKATGDCITIFIDPYYIFGTVFCSEVVDIGIRPLLLPFFTNKSRKWKWTAGVTQAGFPENLVSVSKSLVSVRLSRSGVNFEWNNVEFHWPRLSGLGLSLENLITDGRLFTQTSFKTVSRGRVSRYEVNLGIIFYPLLDSLPQCNIRQFQSSQPLISLLEAARLTNILKIFRWFPFWQ